MSSRAVLIASAMSRWRFAASGQHRMFAAAQLAEFLADGPFDRAGVRVVETTLQIGVPGLVAVIDKPAAP